MSHFHTDDVTYSTSPGGLSTQSYHGHTFWDVETWMWPTYNIFYPELARAVLQYRVDRVSAARSNAKLNNFQGTMFPWEVCHAPLGLLLFSPLC